MDVRPHRRHRCPWRHGPAILACVLLSGLLSACGQQPHWGADAVETDQKKVTLAGRPTAIVSLSPTATEMLWAMGAGDQVVAVDDQSDYPEDVPVTKLSGFEPNVEDILGYKPDLVVAMFDPGSLVADLERARVPTLILPAATTLDEMYGQFERLGAATRQVDEAAKLTAEVKARLDAAVAGASNAKGLTYYHEVDPSMHSVTSDTFMGQVYGLFGMSSIGDHAEGGGSYPQLSEEFVIAENPDVIFLADGECCGVSPEQVISRSNWDSVSAVVEERVQLVDGDIVSRWSPRIVDVAESVASILAGQPASAG